MIMMMFDIFEYDKRTQKYTSLGNITEKSREKALRAFIKETKWTASHAEVILWARTPICK
ncbi:MAG TPA: hypothetical protein DEQ32_13170 [Gammaproteobacteria bacterium]|nr:hypothetical protein [Gammaproteobacteria bacterium]